MDVFDVIVVAGGNAALSAALAARHIVPRVLVLERAPEHMRGGNSRHTRNVRCAHASADQFFSAPYSEEELLEDLISVTGGPANLDLAKFAIRQSSKLPKWMSEHGASWQQPLAGTLSLGRTNRFFLGGGKALLNAYYRTAHGMGISVRYDAFFEDLVIENDQLEAVTVQMNNTRELIRAHAVVIAAGGYEANIEWLECHWGAAADNIIVRGTPYNDGAMLANLLGKNAKPMGDPKGFHAVAVDARSPKFDGGIVTRLDAIPFGIVVNKFGRRFYDEGEAIWPKRYAIWGGLIAGQPDQIAYVIVDAKTIRRFLPPMFKPYQADSLAALAGTLGLDPVAFTATLNEYNHATSGQIEQHLESPDGNGTRGISPPKSNWAIPIDTPPFYALPLRPGITFTYMGVAVDEACRVLTQAGGPFHKSMRRVKSCPAIFLRKGTSRASA